MTSNIKVKIEVKVLANPMALTPWSWSKVQAKVKYLGLQQQPWLGILGFLTGRSFVKDFSMQIGANIRENCNLSKK